MSARGADALRRYLHEAVLPQMLLHPVAPNPPPTGHKSHLNSLSVRPETWRRLESIHPLDSTKLNKNIAAWMNAYIPSYSLGTEDIDMENGERLSLPCPPFFNVPPHLERRPPDIARLSSWLDNLPLMTVQRTMHLVNPETYDWEFSLINEDERDQSIFQHFVWVPQAQKHLSGLDDNDNRKPLVVAFQPPWILSEQDLKEFSECRSFPPFRMAGNLFPSPLTSKERLWAKLWDTCANRRTPWFVVTSYNQWVFGVFSLGWTTGFVTEVFNYDTRGPTIIEHLTYWTASAMRLKGSCRTPEVPEPVHNLAPVLLPEPDDTDISTATNSESNWAGKNDEVSSSAGVHSTMSPTISEAGLPHLAAPINRPVRPHSMVQEWMQSELREYPVGPLAMPTNPPIVDASQQGIYQGDWLA